MLNNNSMVQMFMIVIVIAGVIFVNPISGLPQNNQLIPLDNANIGQLVINSAQEKANHAQVGAIDNLSQVEQLEEQEANSNPDEVTISKDQVNSNSDEVKQIVDQDSSKQEEVKLVEEQAISNPDLVNSELEDISLMSLDAEPATFDLSKDEAVNNQASLIENDSVYLFLNKGSIDEPTNLGNENDIIFLPEDNSADIANLNYMDYMYLMDNKENSIEGENSNKNGQGIDDMFYKKPLGLYPNTQRLSVENLNDFFDDKVIADSNAIDYGQYIQSVNDVARIRIITFFEENPDTFEQNQGLLPNIDYPNNFEISRDEAERQFSATKSRMSLFIFGWMFMVTGIALSCFIVIVGRKAASKRTLKVKKFTAPGEQPYHALGGEV